MSKKLTVAEVQLLKALAGLQYGRLSVGWLKPATYKMARRMRQKGLLSKRDKMYAKLTQAGYDAARRS